MTGVGSHPDAVPRPDAGQPDAGAPVESTVAAESARPAENAEPAAGPPLRRRDARPERKRSLTARIGGIVLRVVSWTVLIVSVGLIVAFVLVPRVTGSTPYTVLTGSMRPSMPPGTTVVVRPIDFDQITVGDVITYQLRSGEPEVVTHRVVGITVTHDGARLLMQGDANAQPDAKLVREEQVRGKAWYWLPVIGYFTSGVTSDARTWLAQGLGLALIGYALVTIIVMIARRRRSASE